MGKIKSCYKCPKRYIGCHGKCKTYKDEVQENAVLKQKILEDRCVEHEIYLYNKSSAGMR